MPKTRSAELSECSKVIKPSTQAYCVACAALESGICHVVRGLELKHNYFVVRLSDWPKKSMSG